MLQKLKNISSIQHGIYHKTHQTGDILYLLLKDFQDNIFVKSINCSFVNSNNINDTNYLQKGDVIFAAKGHNNFAWIYSPEIGKAVASTSFFVIRLSNMDILPEFLVVLLNNTQVNQYFYLNATGSNIKTIKKGIIENLEIPVLPIKKQEDIIRFSNYWDKYKKLNSQIIEKKEKMYQHQLYNKLYH